MRLHLPFGDMTDFDRWSALEDKLAEAVAAAGVGELDGNEVGQGEYTIWLYGASAPRLAETVKAALAREELPPQCFLFLRHGDVEDEAAKEETIPVS